MQMRLKTRLTSILSMLLFIQQAQILSFSIILAFPLCQDSAFSSEWIRLLYPSFKSRRKQYNKGKCTTLYYTIGMKRDLQSLHGLVHTPFIVFSKLIKKK